MKKNSGTLFSRWWVMLLAGIVSVVIGLLMIRHPLAAFETLTTLVLVNFIIIGLVQVVYIVLSRKTIPHWGRSLIGPALMVVIGILIAATPFAKEKLFCVFAGVGIILEGISSLSGAITLRRNKVPGATLALILAVACIIAGLVIASNFFFTITYITAITAVTVLLFGVDLITGSILMHRMDSLMK